MKLAGLDIETLDLERTTAVVFEIGVALVDFDEETEKLNYKNETLLAPDLSQQIAYGRTISPKTVAWHVEQHKGNREELASRLRIAGDACYRADIKIIHAKLGKLLGDADEIWINGLSFDPVVLHYLFAHEGLESPWDFRKEKDVRTIRPALDIIGFQCPPIEGKRHCAVPDAKWNLELAKGYHQHVLRNLKTIRLAMDTAAQPGLKFSSCSTSMNSCK